MTKISKPTEFIIESKRWTTPEEIDKAIKKLERRIKELNDLDVKAAILGDTGADETTISNVRQTIRDIFGAQSPEFHEHKYIELWVGPVPIGMDTGERIEVKERGKSRVIGILNGLINRLKEIHEDLISDSIQPSQLAFKYPGIHPLIAKAANTLFENGHYWEAVFGASKALVNYVKEFSGQQKLDGAALMRSVFSRNNPILSFNARSDQTDLDEQEGFMHLFEGAVLAIRNPGAHIFPKGPPERAFEYLVLLSLLAFRVQEAKRE